MLIFSTLGDTVKRLVVNIELSRTENGGRHQKIPASTFGCPIFFEDLPELGENGYDCRLLVAEHGRPIAPGETAEGLQMIFLSEDLVFAHMKPGVRFVLWESGPIGKGVVVRVEKHTAS